MKKKLSKSFIKTLQAIDPSYRMHTVTRCSWDKLVELKVSKWLAHKLTQWKSEH
jgi:hypothetical protein